MKISEMKVGQMVTERLVLSGAEVRKTKGAQPSNYLSMAITDGTDVLDGKIWNYSDKNGIPEVSRVYVFGGTIGEFAGKKQIVVQKMSLSPNQDMREFSCTYTDDVEGLWTQVMAAIETIDDAHIKQLTKYIYTVNKDKLMNSTSAKAVHHVGIGGNLAHTLEVFNYGLIIAARLINQGRAVNMDLVRAGTLLHDVGKAFTYSITGPVIDYTFEGQLLDHIIIGIKLLEEALATVDETYRDAGILLAHIIAAHHGQLEYGSPVTPKFAEAYIVNLADGISASLDTLFTANDKAVKEGKEMTDRLYTLGNREHILQTTLTTLLSNSSGS